MYLAAPIRETGELLKVLVRKVYNDMADVDRRLRGRGYPRNVVKKDVRGKVEPFLSLIDERVRSELSARKRLNEFRHNNPGLTWLIGIIIILIPPSVIVPLVIAWIKKKKHNNSMQ